MNPIEEAILSAVKAAAEQALIAGGTALLDELEMLVSDLRAKQRG